MATFQIHQDSEKENPHAHHMPLKEKTLGVGSKTTAFQPSLLGAGLVGATKQTRSNFAVLKNNANNGNARTIVGGSKVAFREVGYNKGKDENAAVTAAAKKSTVVPVVEQFKAFSVYEDQCDVAPQQQQQQPHPPHSQHIAAAFDESTLIDKENVYSAQQQQQQRVQIDVKSEALRERDLSINDVDYALDTTPMSVSDVLSPMSVDRSAILQESMQSSLDDSNVKKVAEFTPLPRNDRQRFFEVVAFQRDILQYFRESEKKHRPKPHYMRRQTDINYSMRTILVDWLVEVSEEYNLDTETLYLSVSYIDRFLSHMSVVRSKLQLVGTAAMFIASKYEEIYPPDVGEFVFITDDTYSKAQVLRMEQIILKILAFDLCTPTAYVYINTYAVLTDIPDKVKYLTMYISELSLLDADPYLRFYPSIISAASLALARYILDMPIWSLDLEDVTTYRLEDLKEVLLYLCKSHSGAPLLAQQAIQEKYKAEKYKQVSAIKPVELDEELFDEITAKYNEEIAQEEAAVSSFQQTANASATDSKENVRRMISLMFNGCGSSNSDATDKQAAAFKQSA